MTEGLSPRHSNNMENKIMVDLSKIQSVIETEVERAISGERKRIITAVGAFSKGLIDAIKSGGEEVEDEAPKPAAKLKAVKPSSKAAEDSENIAATNDADSGEFDISEVEDEEANESRYAFNNVKTLKAECKKRGIELPKGCPKIDMMKFLILHDEDSE